MPLPDASTLWEDTPERYVYQLRKNLKATGDALGEAYRLMPYQEWISHRTALKHAYQLLKSNKTDDIADARRIINQVRKALGFKDVNGYDWE